MQAKICSLGEYSHINVWVNDTLEEGEQAKGKEQMDIAQKCFIQNPYTSLLQEYGTISTTEPVEAVSKTDIPIHQQNF